jgi:hypothetical protein
MEENSVIEKIRIRVADRLGGDAMDLEVTSGIYNEVRFYANVYVSEIIIIKPASKRDMLKLAMPKFIQRLFPPKTVEVRHIVSYPALKSDFRKEKLVVPVHYTQEMIDYPNQLIDWFIEAGSKGLKRIYMNRTFRGW